VGRVSSPLPGGGAYKICTATLVGKRHIVTASNCATWINYQDDSAPEPMIFQPGYNLGSRYPESNVIHSYWIKKVSGHPWQQEMNGGDFLVGVLDRNMEETNGFFGQIQYETRWNGLALWDMTSYPDDLNPTASQQFVQGPMTVTQSFDAKYSEIYLLLGVLKGGDSGSPLSATYKNEYGLIGVVSGQASFSNPYVVSVNGGPSLFDSIAQAVKDYP
jgi:hypothetical protein